MQAIAEKIKRDIENRFGKLNRVGSGNSLFYSATTDTFIYFRYGKMQGIRAYYGLKKEDVDIARGNKFYVCFVTDHPDKFITIPYAVFEMYFDYAGEYQDGQYKPSLFFLETKVELYIPKSGRFSVGSYLGLGSLFKEQQALSAFDPKQFHLSHAEAQSLLGAVGIFKGLRIWFPKSDWDAIDPHIINSSHVANKLPSYGPVVDTIFQEIDVVWLYETRPVALFEVEHSTPIYSGLLRINDVLLSSASSIEAKIVAAQERRDAFQRQIRRPTFQTHKLEQKVSFMSYENLWHWRNALNGN